METREAEGPLVDHLAGRVKRSRPPGFYNEARRDAELEERVLQSEAERRGKRKRRAVSYDHAYLTQDWDDNDFEEDEVAFQHRQAKRGQPIPGLSLYEVCSCGLRIEYRFVQIGSPPTQQT